MKKRLLSCLAAATICMTGIIASMGSTSAYTYPVDDARIFMPNITTTVGETITIPVEVKDFDGYMSSCGLLMEFDDEYLSIQDVKYDDCVDFLTRVTTFYDSEAREMSSVATDATDKFIIQMYSAYNRSELPYGNYPIAYITFKTLKSGETSLKFDNFHCDLTDMMGPTAELDSYSNSIIIKGDVKPKVELTKPNSAFTHDIMPAVRVSNPDGANIDMTKLELRYYFTSDGVENIGYRTTTALTRLATGGRYARKYVNGKIVAMDNPTATADSYVSIKYNAYDTLTPKGEYFEVYFDILSSTVRNGLNPTNDYSYINNDVAVFYDGKLVSGTIPQ